MKHLGISPVSVNNFSPPKTRDYQFLARWKKIKKMEKHEAATDHEKEPNTRKDREAFENF